MHENKEKMEKKSRELQDWYSSKVSQDRKIQRNFLPNSHWVRLQQPRAQKNLQDQQTKNLQDQQMKKPMRLIDKDSEPPRITAAAAKFSSAWLLNLRP